MKKIPVKQLRIGMYIQEICGSWMDHPFWKSSFLLNSKQDLETLLDSSVSEVWIDPNRGLDVESADESLTAQSSEEVLLSLTAGTKSAPPIQKTTFEDEINRAKLIHAKARKAVVAMFSEVRMGKSVPVDQVYPLVDEIHQSVARNTDALLSLVRLKNADDYTYLHSVAVCTLMVALGKQMGLEGDHLRSAGVAGLLHDVGKMMVPDHVLNKPDRLTDEEFSIIQRHPRLGYEALVEARMEDPIVLDVCLHHHERTNGRGYPENLDADSITLFAKMGSVCDVYDAITSDRCYKKGWEPAEAIRKMVEWQDGHFDKEIFHAFIRTVGIYPQGTLVRLKSGRLALVVEQGKRSLLTPVVKVFFSLKQNSAIQPERIDLSKVRDAIEAAEDPEPWKHLFPPL